MCCCTIGTLAQCGGELGRCVMCVCVCECFIWKYPLHCTGVLCCIEHGFFPLLLPRFIFIEFFDRECARSNNKFKFTEIQGVKSTFSFFSRSLFFSFSPYPFACIAIGISNISFELVLQFCLATAQLQCAMCINPLTVLVCKAKEFVYYFIIYTFILRRSMAV